MRKARKQEMQRIRIHWHPPPEQQFVPSPIAPHEAQVGRWGAAFLHSSFISPGSGMGGLANASYFTSRGQRSLAALQAAGIFFRNTGLKALCFVRAAFQAGKR